VKESYRISSENDDEMDKKITLPLHPALRVIPYVINPQNVNGSQTLKQVQTSRTLYGRWEQKCQRTGTALLKQGFL